MVIGVLQNSILTNYVDVYVAVVESLPAPPLVTAGEDTLEVETVEGGSLPLYRGRYVLESSGDVLLVATATDVVGNVRSDSLAFSSFEVGREGGVIASPDGAFEAVVPAGALAGRGFLTLFRPESGEDALLRLGEAAGAHRAVEGWMGAPSAAERPAPAIGEPAAGSASPAAPVGPPAELWRSSVWELGPRGLAVPGLEVHVALEPAGYPGTDPAFVAVESGDETGWSRLESFHDRERPVLIARPDRLGAFRAAESTERVSAPLVTALALLQNRPNPFNPSTRIVFELPAPASLSLRVFDLQGRLVRTLVSGPLPGGIHEVTWGGRDDAGRPVSSGVYYYRLEHPDRVETRKMILLR
jgi:hypothetical protein